MGPFYPQGNNVAETQQKAAQIMHEAEQAALELSDKAKIEAGEKWVSIVNQATEIAKRTMKLANIENQAEQEPKQKQRKRSDTQK